MACIYERIPRSAGDDLLGFKIDCGAFVDDDSFVSTEIHETGDTKNMLEIVVNIDDSIPSIQMLTEKIGNLFLSIEYQNYSCHGCQWTEEALPFRFVTVISSDQFLVSGTIKVIGENYEKRYSRNQRPL